MALTSCIIFVLCLTVIPFAVGGFDCESYIDSSYKRHPSQSCRFQEYCCGSCDNRYCCSDFDDVLHQLSCTWDSDPGHRIVGIVISIVGFVIFIICIITCCICPCCCLYKMCRKPTPVVATTTTTVVQAPYPPQPSASHAYQGTQYPGYQPVPVQPGFGGQPMPTAPYQGQPYSAGYHGPASGPPPPYHEAGAGYPPAQAPYSHAGYNAGQPAYPLQPPTQPGHPPQPDYNATQPAYNPAYMEPPKTG
ncbi:hypothetical protein GJAV_G00174380 [Gymnothorax javanicus]|nr:hypothetical protein GJAV_G00174380 [Gymnothorax javanicus]